MKRKMLANVKCPEKRDATEAKKDLKENIFFCIQK